MRKIFTSYSNSRFFLFEYAKGKQLNVREMYFIFNYFPMLSVLFQFSESELWYISHQRWRKSALGRYTRFFCVWHFWLHAPHSLTLTLSKLKIARQKARVITSELWLHSHTRVFLSFLIGWSNSKSLSASVNPKRTHTFASVSVSLKSTRTFDFLRDHAQVTLTLEKVPHFKIASVNSKFPSALFRHPCFGQ